jgi:hypothetical protein
MERRYLKPHKSQERWAYIPWGWGAETNCIPSCIQPRLSISLPPNDVQVSSAYSTVCNPLLSPYHQTVSKWQLAWMVFIVSKLLLYVCTLSNQSSHASIIKPLQMTVKQDAKLTTRGICTEELQCCKYEKCKCKKEEQEHNACLKCQCEVMML